MPNYIEEESAALAIKFADVSANVDALCMRAHNLPTLCASDEDQALLAPVIVELRDFFNTLESERKREKEPHFRRSQAVDGYFDKLKQRVADTGRTLVAAVDAWNQKKLAAERARREEERRRAEELERQARAKLEAEQKAKAEAEAAAARARKQDSAENHLQRAAEHAAAIPQASHEARQASQAADDARVETMAKPADMVRTRTDEGRVITMKQVPYVQVVDRDKLNKAALWDFIDDKHIEMAAKKWAARGAYRIPMDGLIIEMRDVTEVR